MAFPALKVFISSPNDVSAERHLAEDAIRRINETLKDTLGVPLDVFSWQYLPALSPQLPEQKIQDILNEELAKCQVFLLILYRRYGSTEPGQRKSNTEREVDIAIERLLKKRKMPFLCYFRNIPPNPDQGPQERSVRRFRRDLERKGIFYKTYTKASEFRELLTHDLYRTVLRYALSSSKHQALERFWQLGIPDRQTQPLLAILYPPIDRAYMGSTGTENVWLNRLVPNIVFEDFKALQKIEKCLRLINFRDFHVYDTASAPPDIQYMNVLYLCLPRNRRALQRLENCYPKRARFAVLPKRDRSSVSIQWKTGKRMSESIEVRSPLAIYLERQRAGLAPQGEWSRQLANIVAKDYAVLARFNKPDTEGPMRHGTLKEYFLGGIRGLGTWGAGWYIDRQHERFRRYEDDDEFQLLLEVEYKDGRIAGVRDVSDENQKYFDEQNETATIERNIEGYREIYGT